MEMKSVAGGHRADFEREYDRTNKLLAELLKANIETTAAQARAAHLEGALSTVRQPWWRRLSRLSHWKSSFVGNGRWPGNALKTVIRRANKEDRAAA